MSKKFIFPIIAAVVVMFGLYTIRYPHPGEVVNYRSSTTALGSTTVLLLESSGCLVLSDAEMDIGKKRVEPNSERSLYQIAVHHDVSAWADGDTMGLQQSDGDHRVVPGQPFEAVITFKDKPAQSVWADVWHYGWPISDDCGDKIAVVSEIISVQDQPLPLPSPVNPAE